MDQETIKTIVITGASSGLGAALARLYAAPGITLGLLGRDADRLAAAAQACRDKGAIVIHKNVDVADDAAMAEWLHHFDHAHPVDLVIANAGISAGTGGGGESLAQIKKIFAINVDGVFNTIHPLLDRMIARRRGRIGIISSIAGFRGSPTAPAYSASKATVRVYGQALQGMLVQHNVHVSVICPGFIGTPMTDVNTFPMPFIMSADKAALRIKEALRKQKTLYAFPWQMAFLARLQNLLPDAVINKLYQKVPAKPAG